MTAWEHSLRVPLIISAPWLPSTHGKTHGGMAEMCDFYRTLSDLAGINPSTVDKGVQCDGLASVFSDPSVAGKTYAFSQTQRISIPDLRTEPEQCVRDCQNQKLYRKLPPVADGFFAPSCFSYNHQIEWMVYTVRSAEWRLTESLRWNGQKLCAMKPSTSAAANATALAFTELYDHRHDTSAFDLDVAEYDNVVASYPDVVATMREALETYVVYCPA
jgi:arylsulfatase A-like enzyme